ncbi:MAG: DUF3343 domain-containing protein [Longimicrobiales bacterium]
MPVILLFDTTHHAIWAEQLASERGVAVQVISAPPGARARCDIALEVLPEQYERFAGVLQEARIPFERHMPPAP